MSDNSVRRYAEDIAQALSASVTDVVRYIERGDIKIQSGLGPGLSSAMTLPDGRIVAVNSFVRGRHLSNADVLETIRKARSNGEGNFFHIVDKMRTVEESKVQAMNPQKVHGHDMIPRPYMGSLMWIRSDMCIPFHYFALQHVLVQRLHRGLDAVFEIGSGFGDAIAELAVRSPFKGIDFFGGEISLNGLRCLREFADMLGMHNIRGVDFNIAAPNFDFLKGKKKILVFSQFSLVYVNPFPEEFFNNLLDAVEDVEVVIVEPISFSLAEEATALKPLFDRGRAKTYGICGNLWACIRKLQQQGRISIEEVIPDFIGKTVLNATSLVRFKKIK